MRQDKDAFLLGIEQFNRGEFFAAHETWETIWLAAAGQDKNFLQATIQLAAAFHHWKNENQRGTLSLLRRALEKLSELPGSYWGIRVDHLREEAESWMRAIAGDLAPPDVTPKIEFAGGAPAAQIVRETEREDFRALRGNGRRSGGAGGIYRRGGKNTPIR
jgi:hypothetical protein